MGSRASSYLGFGFVFNEWDEAHGDCPYDLAEKMEETEGIEARVLGDACENEIFLAIKESFTSGDWDAPEEVAVNKLIIGTGWIEEITKIREKFGIDYKEPKILMISDFG